MTVLIGFSFRDLTVVAADGRAVADGNRQDVVDDVQKIFKTRVGLIVGAGRSDIIEAVTRRFANDVPQSNEEASLFIRDEISRLGLPDGHPALELTCWLASYVTNGPEGLQAQLALATRTDNYSFGHFPHDRVVLIAPAGMELEVSRRFNEEAQSRLDGHIRGAPVERKLGLCVLMIAGLVKAIAQMNASVGPRWSVGYQDTSNALRVSGLTNDPDAMEWY